MHCLCVYTHTRQPPKTLLPYVHFAKIIFSGCLWLFFDLIFTTRKVRADLNLRQIRRPYREYTLVYILSGSMPRLPLQKQPDQRRGSLTEKKEKKKVYVFTPLPPPPPSKRKKIRRELGIDGFSMQINTSDNGRSHRAQVVRIYWPF